MIDHSHAQIALSGWFYRNLSEWAFPHDIFEEAKVLEAKEVKIPFANFEVRCTYSWKIKFRRYEQYISHYKQDGNTSTPVYKNRKYTEEFNSDRSTTQTCEFGVYQTLDSSIAHLFSKKDFLTSENILKLIDDRNYVSSETMLAQSKQMIEEKCKSIALKHHADNDCWPKLDLRYSWEYDSGFVTFKSIEPVVNTEYRNYVYIKYEYRQAVYHLLICETESMFKSTELPSKKQEVLGSFASRAAKFYLLPFVAIMPISSMLYGWLFEKPIHLLDINPIWAGVVLAALYLHDRYQRNVSWDEALRNGYETLIKHLRTNRHDLCEVFGLEPLHAGNDSGSQPSRKELDAKQDAQEEYYRQKNAFVRKYQDLGYREGDSIMGLKTTMHKDGKIVGIYFDPVTLVITYDE